MTQELWSQSACRFHTRPDRFKCLQYNLEWRFVTTEEDRRLKRMVSVKSGTIFGSIFPDFGGSTLAISVAQFTPTQLALSDRRIHEVLSEKRLLYNCKFEFFSY